MVKYNKRKNNILVSNIDHKILFFSWKWIVKGFNSRINKRDVANLNDKKAIHGKCGI